MSFFTIGVAGHVNHGKTALTKALTGIETDRLKLDHLRSILKKHFVHMRKRSTAKPFRLPIDQVFTIQGLGRIVRGTICEGMIHTGDSLLLLPHNIKVKAKQLQIHHREQETASAGQRVGVSLGRRGVNIKRGDVLVSMASCPVTSCVDIALQR